MIVPAELRVNHAYVVAYKLIINTVCVSAGPFTIICLLAAATVHAVHNSSNTTEIVLMRNQCERHANAMAMLLAVKFVLCYSLTIAITLFEAIIGVDNPNEGQRGVACLGGSSSSLKTGFKSQFISLGDTRLPSTLLYLVDISNLLVVINSATNFIVYFRWRRLFDANNESRRRHPTVSR